MRESLAEEVMSKVSGADITPLLLEEQAEGEFLAVKGQDVEEEGVWEHEK